MWRGVRRLAVGALLVLVPAACNGSPAATTVPATPATTVTTAPVTTEAPDTTEAETTTLATTTTTTAPSVAGTFLIAGPTCLLGWWDGDWQSGDAPPVLGGEGYQVVRLDEPIYSVVGSEPRPWCEPLDLINVEFDPPLPDPFPEADAIAIQTNADVRPYPVELLSTSNPTYVDATAQLLQPFLGEGPEVTITQVIRTDLEGDGVNEVIVAATTIPQNLFAEVGDYSIVYLRKVIEGEVQTALLGVNVVDEPGDVPQNVVIFEVAAVADLNGDGKMEIVLDGRVWEGAFLEVWEYLNDDLGPVSVLSCGCGV